MAGVAVSLLGVETAGGEEGADGVDGVTEAPPPAFVVVGTGETIRLYLRPIIKVAVSPAFVDDITMPTCDDVPDDVVFPVVEDRGVVVVTGVVPVETEVVPPPIFKLALVTETFCAVEVPDVTVAALMRLSPVFRQLV